MQAFLQNTSRWLLLYFRTFMKDIWNHHKFPSSFFNESILSKIWPVFLKRILRRYFSVCGVKTKICSVNLCIQLKCRKLRTGENSETSFFMSSKKWRRNETPAYFCDQKHWLLSQLNANVSTNYVREEEEKIDIAITKARVNSVPFTINRVD